jgi:hypothetical protein
VSCLFALFACGFIGLSLLGVVLFTLLSQRASSPRLARWSHGCLALSIVGALLATTSLLVGGFLWASDALVPPAIATANAASEGDTSAIRPSTAVVPPLTLSPTPTLSPVATATPSPTSTPAPTASGSPLPPATPGSNHPPTTVPGESGRLRNTPAPATPLARSVPTPVPVISHPLDPAPFANTMISTERDSLTRLDDPPRYTLDVTVDWAGHRLAGTEQLFYVNNGTVPLPEVYLRLYPNAEQYAGGALDVNKVTIGGRDAPFEAKGTILKVSLPSPLPPEEAITLGIGFAVTVPQRSDRFGYAEGVMSLGHWYPILAVYDTRGWHLDPYVALGDAFYSETGLYTVQLTVPKKVTVAATGIQESEVDRGDGTRTLTFRSGATRDFALALSEGYDLLSSRVGEVTVNSYYLRDDAEAGGTALNVAADAVKVYQELFGPYPYPELDVAETSFVVEGTPGGMEFPGIVFISSELYHSQLFMSEQDSVVAHEVAHQWWYGVVGDDEVADPWMDEAFATYSAVMYFERVRGPEAAQQEMLAQAVLPWLLVTMTEGDRPVGTSLLKFDNLISYAGIVYGKGAVFLAQLRKAMGDEAFLKMMRGYYGRHKYGVVHPADFLQAIRESARGGEGAALYDHYVLRAEGPGDDIGDLGELGMLLKLLQGSGSQSPEELERLLRELLKDLK